MADPTISRDSVSEDLKEAGPVTVGKEDLAPRIPATGKVIQSPFVFQP